MPAMNENGVVQKIVLEVNQGLAELKPHLRRWAEDHLIQPRQIELSLDPDGKLSGVLWLVTDHTGHEDSSSRVVYDEANGQFGLEQTLNTGIQWYMGPYGSFSECIENM